MESTQKMKDSIIDECEEDGNDNNQGNEECVKFTNGSAHHELDDQEEAHTTPSAGLDSINQDKCSQKEGVVKFQVSSKMKF